MSGDNPRALGRASLFAWQVSAEQEEPWRRFLQELSGPRLEEWTKLRRRAGILAESVWFVKMPLGGGAVVVLLEAEDPERALRELVAELAAPATPFASWLRREMREIFGCDFAQVPRPTRGELLFASRKAPGEGVQE